MSKLRELRKAAKLTQNQLADLAGVNARQIQRVESGDSDMSNITLGNAIKLADALGVDVKELL